MCDSKSETEVTAEDRIRQSGWIEAQIAVWGGLARQLLDC